MRVQVPEIEENIIQKDLDDLNRKFKLDKIHPNLSPSEVKALQSLTRNKYIVIKPADKGSSVIMDRFQYLWEGN